MDRANRNPRQHLIMLALLLIPSCGGNAVKSPTMPAAQANFANWRNDGSGIWPGVSPPTEWSEKEGILWRTDLGESSYSSLIKAGEHIFVANEDALLQCLDAGTGKILWQRETKKESLPEDQQVKVIEGDLESGNAPHTPVTDGEHVYVAFANSTVAAFDLAGQRKWAVALGEAAGGDGRSSSPVLAEGKLLWLCGHLYAIDCTTGNIAWEEREVTESYGTPIVMALGGRKVLVTPGGQVVRIADGKLLAEGMGDLQFASPISKANMAYWVGAEVYAYEFPDKAEPFEIEDAWVKDLDGEFYASGVLHDNVIYTVANQALFYAFDATNGEVLYQKPLPIAPNEDAGGEVYLYASVSLAGGMLYVSNNEGETVVIRPGSSYEQVAVNLLAEGSGATPIFSGSRIYTRAGSSVLCIGKK